MKGERGQVMVIVLFALMVFVLLAAGLIDVWHLLAARNWGYRVAQDAALSGVSAGRVWSGAQQPIVGPTPEPGACIPALPLALDETSAQNTAETRAQTALDSRGVSGYTLTVRVLPNPDGGITLNWPPEPVRLNAGGDWSSDRAAVGVYIRFPVSLFFMSFVGRTSADLSVFASAAVVPAQTYCP